MKTKTGKYIIAASFVSVAFSFGSCFAIGVGTANAENFSDEKDDGLIECEQTLNTVRNDFKSIIDGYNKLFSEREWIVNDIEFFAPVYLIEDKEYGMYLDFDSDNGYIVMTTDKKIYCLEIDGDLEYLRTGGEIYYSYVDGFMYIDNNDNFKKYEEIVETNVDEIIGVPVLLDDNSINFGTQYDVTVLDDKQREFANASDDNTILYTGQPEAGADGKIEPNKINAYVSERYPGYSLVSKNNSLAQSFNYTRQTATSYYLQKYDGGRTYSEGNCVLNAIYNVMRDWGNHMLIWVPYYQTKDISSSILSDILYSTYGNGTMYGEDSKGKYKWEQNSNYYLSRMPILYSDIRNYAVKNGYTVSGYATNSVPATMEYVANSVYSNNKDIEMSTSISSVVENIDMYRACYMTIMGSNTYGNHGVAIVGYHKYKKETKLDDTHSLVEYKYFYEIADGHNSASKIFDPNTSFNPSLTFCYMSRC